MPSLCPERILAEKEVEMVAVTVDEGIAGYRDDTILAAERIARQVGVEQVIVSFREKYGWSLDEMVVGAEVAPCTLLRGLSQERIERAAKSLGATKLATGHNQDDEAQSVMMKLSEGGYGEADALSAQKGAAGAGSQDQALRDIPERRSPFMPWSTGSISSPGSALCPAILKSGCAGYDVTGWRASFPEPGRDAAGIREDRGDVPRRLGPMELAECRECGEPCVGKRC